MSKTTFSSSRLNRIAILLSCLLLVSSVAAIGWRAAAHSQALSLDGANGTANKGVVIVDSGTGVGSATCQATSAASSDLPGVSPVREEIERRLLTQPKVTVELFVMSQCPFGMRAEQVIAPLLKEFGKRVDFKLHFIAKPTVDGFTSMHGQDEVDEDIRQAVMAEKFPKKYFHYVVARAGDYRNADWQTFANKVGIDAAKIDLLANSQTGRRIFAANIQRSNELDISSSPTIYLDGEKYNGKVLPSEPSAVNTDKPGSIIDPGGGGGGGGGCTIDANCNDSNACTTDACVSGSCVNTPKSCGDSNACTDDSCNVSTGACINTAKTCDDGNPNTADSCNPPTGCVFTPTCQASPVVTTNADGGTGSLRQAVIDACAGSTITFGNGAGGGGTNFTDNVADTISLSGGQITIAKNLTIQGPGAKELSVSGNNQSIVFVANSGVNASMSDITITGGNSGGFRNQGSVVLTNCAISGNTIDGTFLVDAAGIRNSSGASMTLTNSTVSGNIAHTHGGGDQFGGGILNYGTLILTNSTVSGNSGAVESASYGGGIYNGGTLTLSNSTVSGNSAGTGGGIWTGGGAATVNVRSTIIAGNTGGTSPDFFGSVTSQGFNLVGKTDGSGGWSVAVGDLTGTIAAPLDPQLAPLANNGGPTQTHALLGGSPAIDKGYAFSLVYDQRGTGFPRTVDNPQTNSLDGTDIGAFESPVLTETDVVVSGGNLTITDVNGGNSNDNITISCSPPNIVITDAGTGLSQTVLLTDVTGSITVNTLGGNDTLTLDLSGCDFIPAGGLTFNGGDPTTAPGDKLKIVGGNQGLVTYNYTNAHDGSIVMANFGTVNYTGLEPLSNTGTATDVVLNLPAGPNAATLADLGGGMSRLSGATFETTDFANPSGSVTINRGNAADTLTVNALAANYPSLNIGTALATFDQVTFAGGLAMASGKSLTVFAARQITLSTAASNISATGSGTVSMTTASNILASAGSSMSVVNGDLTLNANQQAAPSPTTGYFYGVDVSSAVVETSGTGNIIINGRGGSGTTAGGAVTIGVAVEITGLIRSVGTGPTAGGITITGVGGSAGAAVTDGVAVTDTAGITSISGDISITGTGGSSVSGVVPSNGLDLQGSGFIKSTGTGADAASITIIANGERSERAHRPEFSCSAPRLSARSTGR